MRRPSRRVAGAAAMLTIIEEFIGRIAGATGPDDIVLALGDVTRSMGFTYFALTHHVDGQDTGHPSIRLHNYPAAWVEVFDREGLGVRDPMHRASQRTCVGFRWSEVSALIELTEADHHLLEAARSHGLSDGYTVPIHVVGEAPGSCSFAIGPGMKMPDSALVLAQLAGTFAFEGARRIWLSGGACEERQPRLTRRQRDCLVWAARGKTDWEISRILGISQETVIRHLKTARERYGVQKRTSLLIRALFDGAISFADVPALGHTHFWE